MELMQMEMESGNMLAKASENYRGQSAKRADCFNFPTVCNLQTEVWKFEVWKS